MDRMRAGRRPHPASCEAAGLCAVAGLIGATSGWLHPWLGLPGLMQSIIECCRFGLWKRSMWSKTSTLTSLRVRHVLRPVRSIFRVEKK